MRYILYYIFLYILLIPILRYYILPPGNDFFLFIAVVGAIILFFRSSGSKFKTYHIVSLFFIFWLIVASVIGYNFSDYANMVSSVSKNNFILFVFSSVGLICLSAANVNYDFFVKAYVMICWLLIFFFIYQLLCTFLLHLEPILPFSFLERVEETERNGVLGYSNYFRFSSMFSEPSHFAQYLSPLPAFYLYGYKNIIFPDIKKAVYASLPILFCISGTGIAILAVIWGYYISSNVKKFSAKQLFFLVLMIIIFLLVFYNSVGLLTMLNDMTDSNENKTLDRVSRGFLLFSELPFDKQFWGLGYQCIGASSKFYHMQYANVISNGHTEYLSDISSLLITGGVIGFLFIVYFMKKVFTHNRGLSKIMSLIVLAIMFSESTLGSLMMFYLCMIFSTIISKKYNYES